MWRFHFVLRHTILFCSMFVPAHTHHCIKVQLSIELHRLISVFPIINPHKCMTSEDTDQNSVPNFFLKFDFIKLNVHTLFSAQVFLPELIIHKLKINKTYQLVLKGYICNSNGTYCQNQQNDVPVT